MSDAQQIQLTGGFRAEEDRAAAALSPGHLIEQIAAGTVQKHATEGGFSERAVAVEDGLQGNTLATAYALADLVFYHLVDPGDEAQIFLKAGENVVIGTRLISAGDGTLIAEASVSSGVSVKQIVGQAREALDLSASGAVDKLVHVRLH